MKQVRGLGSRIKEAAHDVTKLKKGSNHSGGGGSSAGSVAEEEVEEGSTAGGTTTVVSDEGGEQEEKVVKEEVAADNNNLGVFFRNRIQKMGTVMTGGANVVHKLAITKRDDDDGGSSGGVAKDQDEGEEEVTEEETNEEKKKFRMPPDDVLQKMIVIGKQKIKGVSIQDYYEVAWSEGNDCDKEPIYGPFLTSCGKNDVNVDKWESQEGGYKGEWCGENYTQQRIVTFNFMKQTIGQTLVSVQHTQRCRRIENDRCILHMTLKMKGFPYADCFVVEVRHVASRVGENDILVEMGLHVRFLKSCMFESKIRSNTTAETTKLQMDLLALITEGCKPYAKEIAGDEEEEVEEDEGDEEEIDDTAEESKDIICDLPLIRFFITLGAKIFLWPFIKLDLFDPFPPTTVDEALTNVRRRVALLDKISCDRVTDEQKDELAKEMKAIQASLKHIEAITSIP
mmetsp:Transcript_1262/g.2047  ORF Transcript_1262/g.2047 Transcript_1262/m.2047 type:complete len:455 (-) Transcript_1262:125-1489(-)